MYSKKSYVFLIAVLAQTRCQTQEGDRCVENYTQTIGKCTPAQSCVTARNDYQKNGIRPTLCTYSPFGTTLVCCRDGISILNAAGSKPASPGSPIWGIDTPNRQADTRRVSERSDDDGDDEYQSTTYPADEDTNEEHDHVKRTATETPAKNEIAREEELLSKLWAIKLTKLTSDQKTYAEKLINDILFEAELGALTKNHLTVFSNAVCAKNDEVTSRFREDDNKINSPLLRLELTVDRPEKCEEYSREVVERVDFIPLVPNPETISLTSAKCDYIGVQLIVGGEKASQGEFPHMAAIGWTNFEDGYDFKCGGSLISNKFVVTAGHCIRDPAARDPAPAVVRLGDQNIDPSVLDGADPIDVNIKQIHKHPDYVPPSKYNDIALLELEREVSFESAIRPACLWTKPDFAEHNMAIATGWGVTDPDTRQPSKELHKVSLSLFNNNYCDKLLMSSRNRLWQGFRDTQMCAGELRGGKDTCQGDSGSPLQVVSKENQCIFNVVGITSFGVKCAKTGHPAIYTRISMYLDWIESAVWPGE